MKIKVSFMALFVALALVPFFAHAATCANLTLDLAQGTTDAKSSGQVSILQNFLVLQGYLTAKPNGVFGPATFTAVKKFQAVYGISTTGTVGPTTRLFIKARSCAVTSTASQTTTTTATSATTQPSTTGTSAGTTVSAISVLAPGSGENLSLNNTYIVKWTGLGSGTTYNVVLEDASGTPQGFIVAGSYATQYSWTVGSINNSNSATPVIVPPGNYRVHVENASQGPQSNDQLSGIFTIGGSVTLNQIFPTTVPADNSTAFVLYGVGFNSTSLVDVYGNGNTSPLYVSPDGRIMVATIPTGTYPGSHTISVVNTFGGSNTTIESNQSNVLVTRP